MTRVLREYNGVPKALKKSMKQMKINKNTVKNKETKEIEMIMSLSVMITNLENQCLQHGLQKKLLEIQKEISKK